MDLAWKIFYSIENIKFLQSKTDTPKETFQPKLKFEFW